MAYNRNILSPIVAGALVLGNVVSVSAQQSLNNTFEKSALQHGIEQYNAELYVQASSSLKKYLDTHFLPTQHSELLESNFDYRQANYYYVLSMVKGQIYGAEQLALNYLNIAADPVYVQRVAYALAQFYFQQNKFTDAKYYYEKAGIQNLTNEEISDAKFELAYCYFYNNDLAQSKNLFAAIKDIRSHKYYVPGNYYYGLLAYNDKDYQAAIRCFDAIANEKEYRDVVPYYQAEIHYYLGNKSKVKELTKQYLADEKNTVYRKEMYLLRAQINFEEKKYTDALPDFKAYLALTEKVRKEVFYEIGYTQYKLQNWNEAIATFKELSTSKDSLGQTSMYLLGDCYLKEHDKKGARNAFGLASEMSYNTSIAEAATFLYAKLSYELGYEIVATRKFNDYINQYPKGANINEAKSLLSNLLLKSSNYDEAFQIISSSNLDDRNMKSLYQKVAVGRGLQLMIDDNYTQAEQVFIKSLDYPINAEFEAIAKFWLAEINYNNEDYSSAIKNIKSYLSLSNSHVIAKKISPKVTPANAQMILGYAQLESGNYDDAQQSFTVVQKQAGEDVDIAKMAILRSADAAFMKKDYNTADKLYQQAIQQHVAEKDYAIYQRAIIAGLNNDDQEKYKLLQSLTSSSNITYKEAAQVEISALDIQGKDFDKAIAQLKNIIATTNNVQVKSNAIYKLAFAYQETEQNQLAINTYKKYIENYPTASDRASAIEALRLLYVAENNFDGYLSYAQSQNLPAIDELTRQQSYFDEIENLFEKQEWKAVIDKTTSFTSQYNNSQYYYPALYYKAEAARATGDFTSALNDFDKVIAGGFNAYSEDAALKGSNIALANRDYKTAKKYYEFLLAHTQYENNVLLANVGLLKAHYELEDFENVEKVASVIVQSNAYAQEDVALANLYLAKIALNKEAYSEAISYLNKVSVLNVGVISAEAKYLSALTLYKQNKLDDAITTADKAAKTSSQYQYWVAKNYMLLAQIMLDVKDYFEANAIVEELKKGVKDATLQKEIDDLYNKVKEVQKANSKLED